MSPLFSNSFLTKEKGEGRCKKLSEAKVPEFIGIKKKATNGKQANARLLPPGEGGLRRSRKTDEGFFPQGGQVSASVPLIKGDKSSECNERDRGSKGKYYEKYSLNTAKENMKKTDIKQKK